MRTRPGVAPSARQSSFCDRRAEEFSDAWARYAAGVQRLAHLAPDDAAAQAGVPAHRVAMFRGGVKVRAPQRPGAQLRHHLDHPHHRGTRQGGTVATAIIYCFKSQRLRSVSITKRALDSQRRHSRMNRGRAGMADQDGVRRRGGDLRRDLIECQIVRGRR